MWIDFTNPFNQCRIVINSSDIYSFSFGPYKYGGKECFGVLAKAKESSDVYHLGAFNTKERANTVLGKVVYGLKDGTAYIRIYDDLEGDNGQNQNRMV